MPVPFAIALFLNQEREVLAVVVLVVHYIIENHAAEHLFHILLALGKITCKRQKVEIIENGVGKGNVEQGSSCGYVNAFACWRNVEATAGKILVVYQFELGYLDATLLGYLIIMILLLSHILWVVGMAKLDQPMTILICKNGFRATTATITTII